MPKVNFSPEDVCGWLHAKSQWKDGARVLTFYVGTPKEAVDVAKNVIKVSLPTMLSANGNCDLVDNVHYDGFLKQGRIQGSGERDLTSETVNVGPKTGQSRPQ